MLFGNVRSRRGGVGCVRLESGGALGAPFLPGADANQPVLQPGGFPDGGGSGGYTPPTITSPGGLQPGGGGSTVTKPPLRMVMPSTWFSPNSPPIISTPPLPPPLTAQPPLQPGTGPAEPYVPPPIDTSPPPPPPGSSATDVTPTVEVLPVRKPWWPWALAAAAAAAGAAVFATR